MSETPTAEKDVPRTPPWEDWNRRFRFGRLAIYPEPRDVWIGVYVAADAVYVCPLPMLVLRWTRRDTSPAKCDNCGSPITTYDPDCCHVAGCHECVLPPASEREATP